MMAALRFNRWLDEERPHKDKRPSPFRYLRNAENYSPDPPPFYLTFHSWTPADQSVWS